ncbi:hypothetical protein OH77DRAFT_1522210 [Trametes cingulata]|nr:hypothetical protein OH77DRAFT_1522210 [Trametes cingulata]
MSLDPHRGRERSPRTNPLDYSATAGPSVGNGIDPHTVPLSLPRSSVSAHAAAPRDADRNYFSHKPDASRTRAARSHSRTRQLFRVSSACDFCRSGQVYCENLGLSHRRCANCCRRHKLCTWGGVNLEGELYLGKGKSRTLVARFNSVGFSLVRHASHKHDWPATFTAVEYASSILSMYGVTPLNAPALAAKTADCYAPGAGPTV